MKRKILAFGFMAILIGLLAILTSKPTYAQTCSGQNIDLGESTTVAVKLSAHPNTTLCIVVECPSGKNCPGFTGGRVKNYCAEFAPTDGSGKTSGIIGPFTTEGTYKIKIWEKVPVGCNPDDRDFYFFSKSPFCTDGFIVGEPSGPIPGKPFDPCWNEEKGEYNPECRTCLGYDNGSKEYTLLTEKVWTALGCIDTDPGKFVAWLLSTAIKIGGGIAFLLMLWGGFILMASSGNPEKLNQGKEILTSAIIGLLFIVFAVFLLKIIGVDIFELPGWEIP